VAKEQFLVNPSEDVDEDIAACNIVITDAELEQFVKEEKNSHMVNKIHNQKEAATFMNTFYEVLDRCGKEEGIIGQMAKCSETVWSSHYSDHKL
jgi:Tfp pilus assembly pilus retraction ATPase PilT